jgi:two-component system response regulator HydG
MPLEYVKSVKDHPMIGRSPQMERLQWFIAKLSHSNIPVVIEGESGTGKELVARAIHLSGPNRDKPFLAVDCGSIVATLIESELFGHVHGAFTGAVRSRSGLLAVAEGGTVLLDEIGELPVDVQSKLLRVLQEKEVRPVGSNRSIPIRVRILAATNRDLEAAVQQGTFRRDLYFRLNVLKLHVPPLRERKEDLPLLVSHFLEKLSRADGVVRNISDEALKLMLAYDWPGNVRELEHSLEHASVVASSPILQVEDLPSSVGESQAEEPAFRSGEVVVPLAELERQAILFAITQASGDKLKAARLLGIGKTTLYRKLRAYRSNRSKGIVYRFPE